MAATVWYANVLKKTRCDSIETTIRVRRLVSAGDVARHSESQLPSRLMFTTVTGGASLKLVGQPNTWEKCFVDHLESVSNKPSHSTLVFGVDTVLWPMSAQLPRTSYRGLRSTPIVRGQVAPE